MVAAAGLEALRMKPVDRRAIRRGERNVRTGSWIGGTIES